MATFQLSQPLPVSAGQFIGVYFLQGSPCSSNNTALVRFVFVFLGTESVCCFQSQASANGDVIDGFGSAVFTAARKAPAFDVLIVQPLPPSPAPSPSSTGGSAQSSSGTTASNQSSTTFWSTTNIGIIAGVGGAAVAALIVILMCCLCKRRDSAFKETEMPRLVT